MDFNYKKPLHILALVLISMSFILIIISPIFSYFEAIPSTQSEEYQQIAQNLNVFLELFMLAFQLIFAFVFFILFPILWYILVNSINFKKALYKMRLRLENIDIAFLWGILATILIYALSFTYVLLLQKVGMNVEDLSNVPDLEALFSPPILFLLVAIMPIAEEIFFRGFLLEKIESFAGKNIAIISTSVLFGIAHLSYGKIYPVFIIILIGILLAYIV